MSETGRPLGVHGTPRVLHNRAAAKREFFDEARAQSLRSAEARFRAEALVRARGPGVAPRFTTIDAAALGAWTAQWRPLHQAGQPGGWDWREERQAHQNTIGRFEAALWSGTHLCGLAVGKPSHGPSHVAVLLLEGCPNPGHPLRGLVLQGLLIAAEEYARALAKREVRVIKPLPGVLPLYQALGYAIAPEGSRPPYCYVKL